MTPRSSARAARRGRLVVSLVLSLSLLLACKHRSDNPAPGGAPTAATPPARPAAAALGAVRKSDRIELIERLSGCEIEHHGRLLDLGGDAPLPWTGFRLTAPTSDEVVERDGATYLEARTRDLDYDLWLDERLDAARITLRGRAGTAKRVQAVLDGRRLGVARLPEGEPKSFALPELNAAVEPGLHRVRLRFTGGPRASQNPLAELDWLRLASPSDHREDASFAAPTLLDIVADVALGGVPRRALVLRAPSTVRCFLRPAAGAHLRVALGFWGSGHGSAELAARREGGELEVLATHKVAGSDSNAWTMADIDLGRFAGEPVALELRAPEATRGGRIAFGDPEIVRADAKEAALPTARVVVLVVLSSIDQADVPPWGPTGGMTALAGLVRGGTTFSRYRAPTTVASGVLTTLLTGLLPRAHGVQAPLQRVPAGLRTLPRLLEEAAGSAAMFTSVPTSFAPFGFNAGFDTFEALSPVKDIAASEPFTRAAAWLSHDLEERPSAEHLVVIHARGGHPPWDISREEAAQLRPTEYNGAVEPRRGGIILGALRARQGRSRHKLGDDDWTRLSALTEAALAKQDAGLTQLIQVLKKENAWDGALIVVMGDVSPGAPPALPFDPSPPLDEERLSVPLIVKLPFGELAGKEIQEPVTAVDVAATIARALDLVLPPPLPGVDLALRARGGGIVEGHAQHATLFGRYATRQGPWLLRGMLGETPHLCALDVDPACAVDVFADRSIAARTVWLATLAGEAGKVPKELGTTEQAPVELDPETRAALTVWGDIPP